MGDVPEMVEKVARAICVHITDIPLTEEEWRWGAAENPTEAASFRKAARAVIEAMREPTDAMRLAAYDAVERDNRWDIADDERWAISWRAAIDAALASQGNGRER